MLRISAARLRHMLTNIDVSSLRQFEGANQLCAFLKLANSSAEGALSPRRGDEISPCFSQ